jgi:hypothetical protein
MSQEEKQIFLRQNILDKGYDTNTFVEFMMNKKGGEEGADVSNWSMSELKIVVREFISLQEKSKNKPSLLNTYRNITDPLRQGQPKIPKVDNLNGNANNNQGSNQKNSSMTDFFVNQNAQNSTNQFLYNNINNQNNITFNNANLQQLQQLQYLQQYLALMNAQQNPQFQNQLLQLQQAMNLQKNTTVNNVNNVNNITFPNFNQINPNLQANIINPQHQNNQSTTPTEKEGDTSNENQQSDSNNANDSKDSLEQSVKYGIVTNTYEDTKSLDNTPLGAEENAIIQVTSPEKIEGGFFSKSYVTYLITTNPLNLKVRRRYSDFEWFRQMLQNLYNYNVIPSTPKKSKIGIDKFGDPFLQKRMRTLEKFLNYTLKNPVLKSSQILYDFISIEKDADFQKKKKEYEKIKPSTNINDFQMPNGSANVQLSSKKMILFENIKDNINLNETLLTKLNDNLKALKLQLDNLCTKVDEIVQNWDDLRQNSVKYFDGDEIAKTYEYMHNLFKNWSDCLKSHGNLIHIDIREHFKYTKNNFRSMKDLVTLVETNRNTYNKNERSLMNKKEELFKKGDTNKWELNSDDKNISGSLISDKPNALIKILPKDTNNVINMKKSYGFYLNRLIEEYERFREINSDLHKKIMIRTCIKLIEIYGDYQKATADIMNFFNNEDNFEKKEDNENYDE